MIINKRYKYYASKYNLEPTIKLIEIDIKIWHMNKIVVKNSSQINKVKNKLTVTQ